MEICGNRGHFLKMRQLSKEFNYLNTCLPIKEMLPCLKKKKNEKSL